MVGMELYRPARQMEILGVARTARGGSGCLLLSGLDGSFQRTLGTLVKGSGCLGESKEGWRRRLVVGWISGRKVARCLWC